MFFTFLVILVVAIAVMSAFTSNLKDPKIAPKIKPFNYPAVEKVMIFMNLLVNLKETMQIVLVEDSFLIQKQNQDMLY